MDNKTLRRVVNYDHEASACQLWQTLGRCCRDGKPGNGIILTRARSGGEMFANRLCLRTSILSQMTGFKCHPDKQPYCSCNKEKCECELCKCCSLCTKRCMCSIPMDVDDDDDDNDDDEDGIYSVLGNVTEQSILEEDLGEEDVE
jgi:hypothetical protein